MLFVSAVFVVVPCGEKSSAVEHDGIIAPAGAFLYLSKLVLALAP
jgi:hypothetical protein